MPVDREALPGLSLARQQPWHRDNTQAVLWSDQTAAKAYMTSTNAFSISASPAIPLSGLG